MSKNKRKKLIKPLQINSFVVFDATSCPSEIYHRYYKDIFPLNKLFIFMGEIKQIKGHCILCDLDSGKIIGMFHTENFREATEDEY